MRWHIPAKTFLLGEYAAISEASAIVLTTAPYFELILTKKEGLSGISTESPAGQWWQQQLITANGLYWNDPYDARGGLGASSAQFLGSYLASCYLSGKAPELSHMLKAYYNASWSGKGLRPSGYDVIAQSQQGCVYINLSNKEICSYTWPFSDLSFFLIHTGKKLATHHHLQDTTLPTCIDSLSALVDEARSSFERINPDKLINTINQYHQQLTASNRVAEHSLGLIHQLKSYPEVCAIKGCGALGSDVLLIITTKKDAPSLDKRLRKEGWMILATENNLWDKSLLPLTNRL